LTSEDGHTGVVDIRQHLHEPHWTSVPLGVAEKNCSDVFPLLLIYKGGGGLTYCSMVIRYPTFRFIGCVDLWDQATTRSQNYANAVSTLYGQSLCCTVKNKHSWHNHYTLILQKRWMSSFLLPVKITSHLSKNLKDWQKFLEIT
jgi:hypothetical protein